MHIKATARHDSYEAADMRAMQSSSPSSSLHASSMGRTTNSDGLAATRLSPVHAVNGVAASAACTSWNQIMRAPMFIKHCVTAHISWPIACWRFDKQCMAAVSAACNYVSCFNADLHAFSLPAPLHCGPACAADPACLHGV